MIKLALLIKNKPPLQRQSVAYLYSARELNQQAAASAFIKKKPGSYYSNNKNNNANDNNNYHNEGAEWKWNKFCSNNAFKAVFGLGAGSILSASNIILRNPTSGTDNTKTSVTKSQLIRDLQKAVYDGDERRVKKLIPRLTPADLNVRHELGWQLIHVAAVNGRSEICKVLLENGASVNDIDHFKTPFEMARRMNLDPSVVALIRDTEFNPELSRANFYGCTPLHYAALSNSLETVQVLESFGANPSIQNELGFKPVNYAGAHLAENLLNYEEEYKERIKRIEIEERRRYPFEKRIKEHLVGQDAAISMVAATIRRKENGWFDENHPLVFLFLGSSGIGKTELAKQVANYLHKGNKKGFIRLDMSEYQEKHSVARMIGSPPGYVGHNDGGQLTDALKKCNNAVVLLDEVEKAHPDVLTILLQLFDEGRLTDGKGQTLECKDAIFIMTSNLASEEIARHAIQLREEQQKIKNKQMGGLDRKEQSPKEEDVHEEQVTVTKQFKETIVRKVLKRHFKRDEFLGRINEMVYFLPFSDTELKQLVLKEMKFWQNRAKERNSIELTWDNDVVDVICKGYNIHYGARSIKYEVERRIINRISELQNTMPNLKKAHICVTLDSKTGDDLISIKFN